MHDPMILRVATSARVAEDKPMSKDEKRGEWNLYVRKDRKTRWHYFLQNPKGGGGGSSSYTSAKSAIAAAIGRGVADAMGKDKVWVIEQVWDYDAGEDGEYVTKKSYWLDLKEAGKKSAAGEATWDDAKAALKDAAKRYKLTVADKGKILTLTNKEGGYGEFRESNGVVSVELWEKGEKRPYGEKKVNLGSFKSKGDWEEALELAAENISL